MDSLSSEILLSIFGGLDSKTMVSIMTICRAWFDVIDQNRSLWEELVLREGSVQALELFDRKSESNLKKVSMQVRIEEEKELEFTRLLEKSKETLQILELDGGSASLKERLGNWLVEFPNLSTLNLINNPLQLVHLRSSDNFKAKGVQDHNNGSDYEVLWISQFKSLFNSPVLQPCLLNSLVSLVVEASYTAEEWRRFLERPSKSLKHLRLNIDGQDQEPQALVFTKLEVLDIAIYTRHYP